MSDIYSIMLEESRQSFFKLENLMSFLDMKAFGIVAINAITLSFFVDLLNNFEVSIYYYVPLLLFIVSLGFVIFCVWTRTWHRQSGSKTIENYGKLEAEDAASQLAINYASCEEELREIYSEKMMFFNIGLVLMMLGFIFNLFSFFYLMFLS
jgi:hypothetical protein